MKQIMQKIYNKLIWISFKFMHPNTVAKKVGVKFGKNCNFRTKEFGSEPYLIRVGNNVHTSLNVSFLTHDGSVHVIRTLYDEYNNIDILDEIVIADNVFIGHSVILLPGTKIGSNVIIGAGAVVKGVVESNSVYAGIPAKYICSIEEYIQKNNERFTNTKHMSAEEKKHYLVTNLKGK